MADLPGPGSPWAIRYGVDSDIYYSLGKMDGRMHSWLAPSRPWLDPRFYDTEPDEDEFAPPTTYQELDELLVTEEFQKLMLMGIPTWKVAPLNSVLSLWGEDPTVLSGHRPEDATLYYDLVQAYLSQRIEIDQRTWLPFFLKNHWFDLLLGDKPDTIQEADGSKWTVNRWTVDDNRIWIHIQFIIEIANRIFLTLIRDNNPWLGTLLYGRIQPWYELYGDPDNAAEHRRRGEDWKILQTPSFEREECARMNRPFLGRDIEPDAEKRREFVCRLLKYHGWGFIPSPGISRGDSTSAPRVGTFARINVTILRLLCGGTISIAERSMLYVRLAITMLHELMHCIHVSRTNTFQENVSPVLHRRVKGEPFINGEPMAEIGRSFEAAVFGGTPWDAPALVDKYNTKLMMTELCFQYPSVLGGSRGMDIDENHPALKRTAPVNGWFLPAAVFWRLQSKGFWDQIPNGINGFLLPRVLCTERQMDKAVSRFRFKEISIHAPFQVNNPFDEVTRRWNEREALWAARRPWYGPAAKEWEKTPWGYVSLRKEVEKFITGFKTQNESVCAEAARNLDAAIVFKNFLASPAIASSGLPARNSVDGEPSAWLFHCLGMLMLAALPKRLSRQSEVEEAESIVYEPSKTAKESGYVNVRSMRREVRARAIEKRDRYYNRLGTTKWRQTKSRLVFLNQANRMIAHVTKRRNAAVSSPFLAAILRLLQYTRATLSDPSFSHREWLPDFPFEIPDYDPTSFQRWSPATGSWIMEYRTPTEIPGLPMTVL